MYSPEPSSTCISGDHGLTHRVILCCMEVCHSVRMGVPVMEEVGPWDIFSTYLLMGKKTLTMIGCSFVRVSTWKRAVYSAWNCCSIRIHCAPATVHSWGHSPGGALPLCCLSHSACPVHLQTCQSQMEALLGRCPELLNLLWV